jgi:DNA polymerase-3 subunit beta
LKLDVQKSGDDGEIAFNVKYVQDLLRNIDAKELHMAINSALEPALFTLGRDASFVHIIMPVRTQG